MHIKENYQELLVCPVCGKEFKFNEDTKYIAAGGYTCSWKCFLTVAKKYESEKKAERERRLKNKK